MKYKCWMRTIENKNIVWFDVDDLLVAMQVFQENEAINWGWC